MSIHLKPNVFKRLPSLVIGGSSVAFILSEPLIAPQEYNYRGSHDKALSSLPKVYMQTVASMATNSKIAYCENASSTSRNDRNLIDDSNNSEQPLPKYPPRKINYLLSRLRMKRLPVPRILTLQDPIFENCPSTSDLKKRKNDELKLRNLEREAIEARMSGDIKSINNMVQKISEIAYGKNVTPQMRQDFLIKYGCAAYTPEILELLHTLGSEHNNRGIIELGAGNGQWAKAIMDYHNSRENASASKKNSSEFILAFDDYSALPLDPKIYHKRTKPAHDYFYNNVRKSVQISDALRPWGSRGRVLLLVFPPPGDMALEAVKEYTRISEEYNDTIVYVGEGKGGVNANEGFFDFFLSNEDWILVGVWDLPRISPEKGFEKCFCFRRNRKVKNSSNAKK